MVMIRLPGWTLWTNIVRRAPLVAPLSLCCPCCYCFDLWISFVGVTFTPLLMLTCLVILRFICCIVLFFKRSATSPISCPLVLVLSMLLLLWFMDFFYWCDLHHALDVDTSCDLRVHLLRCFVLQEKCHMAPLGWFTLFQWPGLSPINGGILFLPSHISHILSSDLYCPVPRLGVFFNP